VAATRLVLLGGGKIGDAIADLLSATGDYDVIVHDRDEGVLERLSPGTYERRPLDVGDPAALAAALYLWLAEPALTEGNDEPVAVA